MGSRPGPPSAANRGSSPSVLLLAAYPRAVTALTAARLSFPLPAKASSMLSSTLPREAGAVVSISAAVLLLPLGCPALLSVAAAVSLLSCSAWRCRAARAARLRPCVLDCSFRSQPRKNHPRAMAAAPARVRFRPALLPLPAAGFRAVKPSVLCCSCSARALIACSARLLLISGQPQLAPRAASKPAGVNQEATHSPGQRHTAAVPTCEQHRHCCRRHDASTHQVSLSRESLQHVHWLAYASRPSKQ